MLGVYVRYLDNVEILYIYSILIEYEAIRFNRVTNYYEEFNIPYIYASTSKYHPVHEPKTELRSCTYQIKVSFGKRRWLVSHFSKVMNLFFILIINAYYLNCAYKYLSIK